MLYNDHYNGHNLYRKCDHCYDNRCDGGVGSGGGGFYADYSHMQEGHKQQQETPDEAPT